MTRDDLNEIQSARIEKHDNRAYRAGTIQRSMDSIRQAKQIRDKRARDERRIERAETRCN